MRSRLAAPALAALALTAPAASAARCLEVKSASQGRCFGLRGTTFDLSWIHSVERTPWRETYRQEASGLFLIASEFSSAGAGIPDRLAPGETFRERSGKMRIENRHLRIDDLRIRLSPLSHHLLHIGGRDIDLDDLFGESVVSIRVRQGEHDETAKGSSRRGPLLRARRPRG
ncbi:MAG TPA: DUF1850 domain-containing protein [Myxococcales bacterium]|nr:DUF1850 domain-containing protein [Myxococcales bacterium]